MRDFFLATTGFTGHLFLLLVSIQPCRSQPKCMVLSFMRLVGLSRLKLMVKFGLVLMVRIGNLTPVSGLAFSTKKCELYLRTSSLPTENPNKR